MMRTFDAALQDLRYALRGIRRTPGFAAIAILSLAIGIGANSAIFSLVNAVLLRPLAYEDPQRLFWVRELVSDARGQAATPVNPTHALAWARECRSLEDAALMRNARVEIASGGEPASVPGIRVSPSVFALLGVRPIAGRAFVAEEDQEGRDRVAVLSESIWRARFQGDPSIVGRSILLDGESHQVVGIVPASFRLPLSPGGGAAHQIFRPLVLSQQDRTRPMGNFNFAAVVRLRQGASVDQALAEMNLVQARFPEPGSHVELKTRLVPVHELVTGGARLGLWMLVGAVGAVLAIVCVNLANLLLSRMTSRSREAAIRTALGASRARQFSQVIAESLLLAVSGGLLGILLAGWIVSALVAVTTFGIPRLHEVRLDSTVVAFSLGLTVLTGLLVGAIPAWRFSRHDPQEALRAGSHTVTDARGGVRLREALIGLEVGLSVVLLIAAGLLTGSLTRVLQVDKGFDVDHVLTVDVDLAGRRYAEPPDQERFYDRLLAAAAAIPGVEAAGLITQLPTLGENWNDPIYLEGAPRERRYAVNNRYASPGYFRAMNVAVLVGRAFDESDRGRKVAVLSTKAAALLWPGDPNPIGRSFMGEYEIVTLVGIVADVRAALHYDPPATAYYPYWQRVQAGASVVVRTTGDPRAAAGALRAALRTEDAQLPIQTIRTMQDVVDGTVAQRRFQSTLMAVFAVAALLVASLGIYGVVSYSVARRRNEIGIRMALGAQRSRLLASIVRQGMTPVVAGLAAGVTLALVLGRAIRSLLFGIQPADVATIAAVAALLLVVGVLACLIPARRAAALDAVAALRLD